MKLCYYCKQEKADGIKIKVCTVNEKGRHQSYNDKPAIVYAKGRKEWHHDGQWHRIHGPAVKDPVGQTREWYINGDIHREDGPAYIHRGELYYFLDGQEFHDIKEWEEEVKKRKATRKLEAQQKKKMKKWLLAILVGGIIIGALLNVKM